jgi:hypothetical protein
MLSPVKTTARAVFQCPECGSQFVECIAYVPINWDINENLCEPSEIDYSDVTIDEDANAWCLDCEWPGRVKDLCVVRVRE